MELKKPEEYNKKWKKWDITTLPILPEKLLYNANKKTGKQLSIILKQLKRKDLSRIVLATDAGREGELIGRTLLNQIPSTKEYYRFWTSQALNSKVIKENMSNLEPLKNYDRLYYAGRARQSADWLVGMNFSRLASIYLGDLFSVGRVQTAVLSLIVSRREEIDNFIPSPYYLINGIFNFKNGQLHAIWFDPKKSKNPNSSHIEKKEQVEKILKHCEGKDATIHSLSKEKKSLPPPQLFSLTELQKVANRCFSFTALKTLSIAQALYEKHKCLSYPRTDARVLGSKSFSQTKNLLNIFREGHPQYFENFDPTKISLKNRRVFNDDKLTDHHALIPLKNASLHGDEKKIFDLVLKRFIMSFLKNFEYEETKIICRVDNEHFKAIGKTIIHLGYKHLENNKEKDQVLPSIEKNEKGTIHKLTDEKKVTRPPPEYTEATLLQDMINPARLVKEQELKKIFRGEVGLGTQATRAQIIETLLQRKYIERKNKNLMALEKGKTLIKNLKTTELSKVLTCPEETAKWETQLEKISIGNGNPRDFMINIRNFVAKSTDEWKKMPKITGPRPVRDNNKKTKDVIGKCPLCQSPIINFPKSYGCQKWKEGCSFKIWKVIAGKKISPTQAKKIIKNGRSDKIKGLKSKNGKTFDATLILQGDSVTFSF